MAQFRTLRASLIQSTALSAYTRHIEFEVRGIPRLDFVPGQWLSLTASKPDGEEMTRAYSIASPPSDYARFAFCLNRVADGFMSNHLFKLATGDEITFQGPFGSFILRPPLRDTVFIATGTGIAPFRSMLHWLLADPTRHENKKFWLLFGVREEQDIYYREEFEKLAADHPTFHFLPTLSRGSGDWQGLRGYVQDHLHGVVGDRPDMHAYICGLEKMVSANRALLKSLGWDRKQILYEKYD
jgi:ferredoxin-NADP reductase